MIVRSHTLDMKVKMNGIKHKVNTNTHIIGIYEHEYKIK